MSTRKDGGGVGVCHDDHVYHMALCDDLGAQEMCGRGKGTHSPLHDLLGFPVDSPIQYLDHH